MLAWLRRSLDPSQLNQEGTGGCHRSHMLQSSARILLFAANPEDTGRLALDKEVREIEVKIRASEHRNTLSLISRWAVQPDDLLQALNEHRPHIVQFSGHGSAAEEIILNDETGKPKPVTKIALSALFHALKDNIRLVVLNACFSEPQVRSIVQYIDCAVRHAQVNRRRRCHHVHRLVLSGHRFRPFREGCFLNRGEQQSCSRASQRSERPNCLCARALTPPKSTSCPPRPSRAERQGWSTLGLLVSLSIPFAASANLSRPTARNSIVHSGVSWAAQRRLWSIAACITRPSN